MLFQFRFPFQSIFTIKRVIFPKKKGGLFWFYTLIKIVLIEYLWNSLSHDVCLEVVDHRNSKSSLNADTMQEFLKRQLGESVSSLEVEVLQNTILPSYIEKWVLGVVGV